ncbi:hypothetical protein ECG_00422 [Echinococcus granulosus]|uniref:Uncharacterized protein n=1 Tax=Echinococcus granulosus TaxID=6210 RepID=A0A068WTU6_ECHGR|nr:hypothetical protein ECG_00422 [Echinococcus granulosus]CDS23587.1 hypothetical protein EgrG_002043000 [Echinococcus granulosus]
MSKTLGQCLDDRKLTSQKSAQLKQVLFCYNTIETDLCLQSSPEVTWTGDVCPADAGQCVIDSRLDRNEAHLFQGCPPIRSHIASPSTPPTPFFVLHPENKSVIPFSGSQLNLNWPKREIGQIWRPLKFSRSQSRTRLFNSPSFNGSTTRPITSLPSRIVQTTWPNCDRRICSRVSLDCAFSLPGRSRLLSPQQTA